MANLNVKGYLLDDNHGNKKDELPLFNIDDVKNRKRLGVIICFNADKDEEKLRQKGFKHFFNVSEWNTRTISYKMTPRSKENFWVEVNLADHCNLNCQCCDHFSPLAKPTFLDYDQYVKDLQRLSELTDNKTCEYFLESVAKNYHLYGTSYSKIESNFKEFEKDFRNLIQKLNENIDKYRKKL